MTGYKGNGLLHKICDDGAKNKEPLYTQKIFLKDSKNKTFSEITGSWCRNCKRAIPSDEALDRRLL